MKKQNAIIAGMLLAFLCFVSCENDLAAIHEAISKDGLAVEVAKSVDMLYSDSAIVRVRVQAPTMWRHQDKQARRDEFPDGIRAEFFGPTGQVQSILTAKYAVRHESEKHIIAQDSVVWKSQRQETLETEELIWDEQKRSVYSNRFVTITKPGERIYGHGFEANEDFTRWKIQAIEGVIQVEGLGEETRNQ